MFDFLRIRSIPFSGRFSKRREDDFNLISDMKLHKEEDAMKQLIKCFNEKHALRICNGYRKDCLIERIDEALNSLGEPSDYDKAVTTSDEFLALTAHVFSEYYVKHLKIQYAHVDEMFDIADFSIWTEKTVRQWCQCIIHGLFEKNEIACWEHQLARRYQETSYDAFDRWELEQKPRLGNRVPP